MYAFSKGTTSILCKDDNCVSLSDATGNIPNIKRIEFNGGCGCGCGYGNFRQGIILDEVRIYNRALSDAEIKANAKSNVGVVIMPGKSAQIKVLNIPSKGMHTLRLCTPNQCQSVYLTIT